MTANPPAYDGLNPFYGGGYAAVEAKDYAGLQLLAAEDVDALHLPKAPSLAPADAGPPQAAPADGLPAN